MRAARYLFALVACVAAGLAASCSASPSPTSCVFESGDMVAGRCLTECESRCSLAARASCGGGTECVTRCNTEHAALAKACTDATYRHWRCVRVGGGPTVRCAGKSPVFEVPAGLCEDEQAAAVAACRTVDAGQDADTGSD